MSSSTSTPILTQTKPKSATWWTIPKYDRVSTNALTCKTLRQRHRGTDPWSGGTKVVQYPPMVGDMYFLVRSRWLSGPVDRWRGGIPIPPPALLALHYVVYTTKYKHQYLWSITCCVRVVFQLWDLTPVRHRKTCQRRCELSEQTFSTTPSAFPTSSFL